MFILSTWGLFSDPEPIELFTFSHSNEHLGLVARKLPVVIMANGTPPHFFKIFPITLLKSGGQSSADSNTHL